MQIGLGPSGFDPIGMRWGLIGAALVNADINLLDIRGGNACEPTI